MTTVICLTDGMASGKSTAARFLREQGAHVIEADVLGHCTYAPGSPAHAQVVQTFGGDVRAADRSIDRKTLGGKVFGQPAKLKKLTAIVWPAIRQLAHAQIAAARAAGTPRVVVLEAAVLFEAGWQDLGDEIWVVIVEREVAIARAMQRDSVRQAIADSRLDAQLSNAQRVSRADVVIDNNGPPEVMLEQLQRHWTRISG
jgi:phosphopantetheine adenylyltransferase/dephospho-CoA kinase